MKVELSNHVPLGKQLTEYKINTYLSHDSEQFLLRTAFQPRSSSAVPHFWDLTPCASYGKL
jgi:hypothetical protein